MRSVFLRTYAALAAVIVAALAATWAWGLATRSPPPLEGPLGARGPLVVREAFRDLPGPQAAETASRRLDAEVRVLPPGVPLPPATRHAVELGLPAGLDAGGPPPRLVVPLPDGRLVEIRPRGGPPPERWPLGVAAALVVLGVVTAWQLRPLDRSLARLSRVAQRLGEGDLSARTELPPTGPAGDLAARFDAMAAHLERLVRGRTELLLAVSHELRTPLQRVRLATELLADSRGEPDERRELAEGVERDLDELDATVAELLDLGRVELDVLRTEVVEVAGLAGELAADARRSGAKVEVAGGPLVARADPVLLRRAIGNLVQNAARYGGGRIVVTTGLAEGSAVVTVEDDGPGIPEDQREHVLEPFVRLDPARDHRGAGLGLAIVHRAIRQHRGELVVGRSAALGGARFELRWPADVR